MLRLARRGRTPALRIYFACRLSAAGAQGFVRALRSGRVLGRGWTSVRARAHPLVCLMPETLFTGTRGAGGGAWASGGRWPCRCVLLGDCCCWVALLLRKEVAPGQRWSLSDYLCTTLR
eukprot:522479-Prymnesium_polylepis.1